MASHRSVFLPLIVAVILEVRKQSRHLNSFISNSFGQFYFSEFLSGLDDTFFKFHDLIKAKIPNIATPKLLHLLINNLY